MRERPVRSILRRRRLGPALVTAGPEETVCAAAKRMAENSCGSILVMDEGRMAGIFTERDVMVRVVAAGRDPAKTKLREVMTADPDTIGADEPVTTAVRRMDEGAYRHLPVVEGGEVVGVLSIRDIPVLELGRMAEELDEATASPSGLGRKPRAALTGNKKGRGRGCPSRGLRSQAGQAAASVRLPELLAADASIAFCSFSNARASIWRMRSRDTP